MTREALDELERRDPKECIRDLIRNGLQLRLAAIMKNDKEMDWLELADRVIHVTTEWIGTFEQAINYHVNNKPDRKKDNQD